MNIMEYVGVRRSKNEYDCTLTLLCNKLGGMGKTIPLFFFVNQWKCTHPFPRSIQGKHLQEKELD